jgi:hypothetical protein
MEMEKSFYVVTFKPAYAELVRSRSDALADEADINTQPVIVALTQGGFGQDIVDDERQAKERFLEYLFSSSGVDLQRTAEVFDQYFQLEQASEFVNLDEEL